MKPTPTWFHGVSYLMALLLVVCVVLQYNDPDPIRWMIAYGIGGVLSALLPRTRAIAQVAVLAGLVTAGWAGSLTYDVWGRIELADLTGKMSEKGGAVEVGREAGGLWIQAVWLVAGGLYRKTRA